MTGFPRTIAGPPGPAATPGAPKPAASPLRMVDGRPLNALSVDVEDWFQVQAFAGVIDRSVWDDLDRRVEANTNRVLDLFAEAGARATFFTLGWVADRHPALLRRMVAEGHEVASHGYGHQLVRGLGPGRFRADLRRAKAVLEDAAGVAVRGFRAPTFSIGPDTPWAFEILAEEGHTWSSSVNPIRHDLYAAPDAPRFPYRPEGAPAGFWEVPLTTVRAGGRNWPCAGGGFFRLLPYPVFRAGLHRVNRRDGRPAVFYFHPWEVDPGQPHVSGVPMRSTVRHRLNLSRMEGRLRRLLRDFAWDRMDRVFPECAAAPPS